MSHPHTPFLHQTNRLYTLSGHNLPSGHTQHITVVAGLNAVVGDEGSGKTALLHALHQAYPDSAALNHALPTYDQHNAHQVWDNLRPIYPNWQANLAHELATELDLTPHLDKPLYMLSAGSRRKVGLVALLASGAGLTLLDQPFSALDMRAIRVLHELLQDASASKHRAWVVADYEANTALPWAQVIAL